MHVLRAICICVLLSMGQILGTGICVIDDDGNEEKDAVMYQDRYTCEQKREPVLSEKFMRWAFETRSGLWFAKRFLNKVIVSRLMGVYMKSSLSRYKILETLRFAENNGAPFDAATYCQVGGDVYAVTDLLNYDAYLDALKHGLSLKFEPQLVDGAKPFVSFNRFFIRPLPKNCLDRGHYDTELFTATTVVSPADGRHLAYTAVSAQSEFDVKDRRFNLKELFGGVQVDGRDAYSLFEGGSLLLSRLCPLDYHRFHFLCDGIVVSGKDADGTTLINGPLTSVNPIAFAKQAKLLCENKRHVTMIRSPYGWLAIVEVGATGVGSVVQTWTDKNVQRGAEKGYFEFGGSTVITLFEKPIQFSQDLLDASNRGVELFVYAGDQVGSF